MVLLEQFCRLILPAGRMRRHRPAIPRLSSPGRLKTQYRTLLIRPRFTITLPTGLKSRMTQIVHHDIATPRLKSQALDSIRRTGRFDGRRHGATIHLIMDPPGAELRVQWSVYYHSQRRKGRAAHTWDAIEQIQSEVNHIRLEEWRTEDVTV